MVGILGSPFGCVDVGAGENARLKTWVLLLIRAVDEDLAKHSRKCYNSLCYCIRPKDPEKSYWKKRRIRGSKRWLCARCSAGYEAGRYCEYCAQLYVSAAHSRADGKEWTPCEKSETCCRWAHVECLEKARNKGRSQIAADDLQYLCCGCKKKTGAKRRKSAYNDEAQTSDTHNSKRPRRKCTKGFKFI